MAGDGNGLTRIFDAAIDEQKFVTAEIEPGRFPFPLSNPTCRGRLLVKLQWHEMATNAPSGGLRDCKSAAAFRRGRRDLILCFLGWFFYPAAAVSLVLWLLVLALHINSRFTNGVSWMHWKSNNDPARASMEVVVVRTFPRQIAIEETFVRGDMNGWNDILFNEYGRHATRFGYFHVKWPLDRGLSLRGTEQMNGLARIGFDFSSERNTGGPNGRDVGHDRTLIFPNWVPMVLLAIPPVFAIFKTRRSLRSRAMVRTGRCRRCGYDLRATPEHCPECGSLREH
jgi:hypothetical protein